MSEKLNFHHLALAFSIILSKSSQMRLLNRTFAVE